MNWKRPAILTVVLTVAALVVPEWSKRQGELGKGSVYGLALITLWTLALLRVRLRR